MDAFLSQAPLSPAQVERVRLNLMALRRRLKLERLEASYISRGDARVATAFAGLGAECGPHLAPLREVTTVASETRSKVEDILRELA